MLPTTTTPASTTAARGRRSRFARDARPATGPQAQTAPRKAYQRGREALRLDPYSPVHHRH